jgi:energy-coupling factor transporter ATP-binding protein EcfA2
MVNATGDIQIQDVGAIELVDIPLRPGTIVKLVGDNGAGKSTAISAVTSAVTGKNAGLKPRDGKMSGKVRMPGVTVSMGARMKRTPTGDVAKSYVIVEDGSGISKILKPGIKDVVAADKKRLEGVLSVIKATLTVEQQREFLGKHYAGFAAARDTDGLGFVETVQQMKLYLDKEALGHQTKIESLTGAITQVGEIPDDVKLEESVESLATQVADLTISVRDAVKAREAADNALKLLADAKPLKPVADLEASIGESRKFIAAQEVKLKDIQESIAEAKLILTRNEALLESETSAASQRETMRKAIDTAPTAEVIAEQQQKLADVSELHKVALLAGGDNERHAKQRQELAELKSKREFEEATRASLKALAADLPSLLHKALESVPGWTVDEDLRLCVEHKRGRIPFSELSPGEGTAKVCLLACQFADYGADEVPIVGLPQECFEGLDGTNRRLLLDKVQEHGLCLLTAECSDEHVEGIQVEVMS